MQLSAGALRYDEKIAIVTGAGNGLGRAHALMFGARGAKVVVNDFEHHSADRVVNEIRSHGGEAVANYDSVENGDAIVRRALDAFGRVDIVINNAGILRDAAFHKMTPSDWNAAYRVHLQGAYSVTHAAWPFMRAARYGRVIFTTSSVGIYGNYGQANYAAMKAGAIGLGKSLALEGRNCGITVNTIAPIASSRLTESFFAHDEHDRLKPEFVSPLLGWLCHERCEETGSLFEAGAGSVHKLRYERSRGVRFDTATIDPETIAAQWSEIDDFARAEHPETIEDALSPVCFWRNES